MKKIYIPRFNNLFNNKTIDGKSLKQTFFGLFLFFCTAGSNLLGQSATWNLTTSNTPVVCGPVTAAVPVAGSSVLNQTSVNANGFSGTNFPGGIGAANYSNTATNYFEYAVTNNSGGTLTFNNIRVTTFYNGPLFMYLAIRYSTDNFATSTLYTNGNNIPPGNLALTGTTNIPVTNGQTVKYRVYGYFTDGSTYRFGNTFFQVSAGPAAPAAFTATPVSGTQINLNGTANGSGNNIILVFNTTNTFGALTPGTAYIVGNVIPGGGTVLYVGAAGNPFFNHTGLIQGNTYYYQLYSVSAGCNLYSTPLTANATTLCPVYTLNVVEGFNTSGTALFPACWTQQFVTGTSNITFQATTNNPVTNPQEGTRFVSWNSFSIATNNETRLVSPAINTTGVPSVNVLFYWFHDNSAYPAAADGVQPQYSINGGVTWVNAGAFIPRVLAGKNGWTAYDITLPGGAGNQPQLKVGLSFISKFGNNCSLDNLLVYPTPTCKIPNSPLTSSAIALTTATISWAAAVPAPALGYEYYVSTSPVAPTTGTVPTGTTGPGVTTANLTGLTSSTVYYFWVRSRCAAADQSQWVGAGSFETLSLYCTATSTNTSQWYINQVSFVGTLLDVTQASGFVASGYQNFANNFPRAIQAQGEGVNVYVQSNFSTLIKAWVDWNNDNTFDPVTEIVYNTSGTLTSTTTFGFVIPAATAPGDYFIRIRTTNSGPGTYGPCGVLPDGETEDYKFSVVASCSALVTAVGDGETCGTGPVTLGVTGNAGVTSFRWYAAATGGVPLATTATGSWTTPSLVATTIYYVTAYNGSCESLVRTAITAKISPIPVLSFTPASPVVCGEAAVLQLNAIGNTEEGILIFEKFESGLGGFTVSNLLITPVTSTAGAEWQSKTSTYVPANTTVWKPAISSGFGTNKFAFATSDLTLTDANTALVSATVNSTGYTSLTLDFSLFYSHYLPDGNNSIVDEVVVEVSTDGGTTWTAATTYVIDQGIGTKFKNNSVNLNTYINNANLKIRFRYHGNWCDGVAIDNVKLYGFKPLTTSFSWAPLGGGNLFTDLAGTMPYTGGSVANIYVRPTAAEFAAGTPLSFTATATLSNGCTASTPISVAIGPNSWTGTVSSSWNNAGNWCGNIIPNVTTTVQIPSGTPFSPQITTAAAVAKTITILPGASLTITGPGILTLPGNFNNQGTLACNGLISLNGTALQSFPGTGNITLLNNLQINNTGAGVSLNKSITISRELRPTGGNLALGNFDITIKSSATYTASVSTVGASAGFTYGTGRFVVERYINTGTALGQHGKSWQFLATPTIGQTIKQSWMENAAPNANPNPGFGTQVSGTTGPGGGFDVVAFLPSMKTYVQPTNSWAEVGNPNSTGIFNSQGYMIFIRGDRSVINFSGANSAAIPTILRARGTIQVGPVSSLAVIAGGFQAVGNPYASTIDFSTVTRTGGVGPNFYVYDPTLIGTQGLGGYQTITAATGYRATPGNFGTTSIIYNTTSDYRNIQSGSAFFVYATGSNGFLNFNESNKKTANALVTRESESRNPHSMFSTNLLTNLENGVKLNDGNTVVFDNHYRNKVDEFDAVKRSNDGENFAMIRKGQTLAVEARKRLKVSDTIYYKMSGIRAGDYTLMFIPENLAGTGLTGELIDKYLNSRTPISLTDTSYTGISITTDAASAASDRFLLVFKAQSTPMPIASTTGAAKPGGDKNSKQVIESGTVSVFPNPLAGRKLQVQFENEEEGKYTIQLTDKYGQVVYNADLIVKGFQSTKTVSLNPAMPAGAYHLKITSATGKINIRQIILL